MTSLRSLAATVGWGLYCSSSWTWCIGMYLPIILVRYWGWPGFWVFAILNVLGCAGFGYLCSRERSERLCETHAPAMVLFSAVTIAYHVFFIAFLAEALAQADGATGAVSSTAPPVTWMAVAGLLFGGLIISLLPERWWPALAALVALVSYATWIALGTGRLAGVPPSGTESGSSLLFAAPIIAFGFLLCPWLDRTFHRARQRTPSVHAFGVFGATFFVIILMTVAYGATGELDLSAPILAHLGTQALFTVAVHLREVRIAPFPESRRARQAMIVIPALGGLLAAYASGLARLPFDSAYLLFLGFYGLVFPAYVLLFMPFRRGEAIGIRPWPQSPRALGLYALLIAALSPLCAIGFVGLRTWLLPIALAAIVGAALLGRGWFRESAGNSAN